jgi:hypothetical protein
MHDDCPHDSGMVIDNNYVLILLVVHSISQIGPESLFEPIFKLTDKLCRTIIEQGFEMRTGHIINRSLKTVGVDLSTVIRG